MYGALQGKNKSETAAKYGEDQVKVCFSMHEGDVELLSRTGLATSVRYPTAGARRSE